MLIYELKIPIRDTDTRYRHEMPITKLWKRVLDNHKKRRCLKQYWPRSGRYCEARLSYRYEAMEKGMSHTLKADMLKKIGREAADIAKQCSFIAAR